MAKNRIVLMQVHADFSDPDRPPCVTCLHAASQTQPVGTPFFTDSGNYYLPPFHVHCRCTLKPFMVGFSTEQQRLAKRILASLPPSKLRPPPPLATAVR